MGEARITAARGSPQHHFLPRRRRRLAAFKIAVACRLADAARSALARGWLDPTACSPAELTATRGSPALALWLDSHAVCPATTRLAKDANRGWTPARHFLFHPGVRRNVCAVMLVSARLRQVGCVDVRASLQSQSHPSGSTSDRRPRYCSCYRLWQVICSFLCRKDWAVGEQIP